MFVVSRRVEQLILYSQEHIVTTVEDSVLRTEMSDLESQEEDDPKCILFFKPMSWLGQDKSLNESDTDKIQKYRSDYNKNPPVGKLTVFASFANQLWTLPLPPRVVLLI